MTTLFKFLKFTAVLIVFAALSYLVITNYSVIFSKTVTGQVTRVERVELPLALIARGRDALNSQVFSFAIGIRDLKTKEIYTASSEDRQWAVVGPGQCAEAVYLPYPPWDFARKGTYFGARLIKLQDCPEGVVQPAAPIESSAPVVPAAPTIGSPEVSPSAPGQ